MMKIKYSAMFSNIQSPLFTILLKMTWMPNIEEIIIIIVHQIGKKQINIEKLDVSSLFFVRMFALFYMKK